MAHGRVFLAHALGVIGDVLDGRRRVLFIALASGDPGRCTRLMRDCEPGLPTIRTTNDMPIVDPGRALMGLWSACFCDRGIRRACHADQFGGVPWKEPAEIIRPAGGCRVVSAFYVSVKVRRC
jgi:hypothetical protein